MPADVSIYGNLLRPAPSLMDNVNALDAADLQRTQLAGAKVNLIGQQQTLADQQAVRALYQRPNFDPLKNDADMQAFSAASPTQALAMRKAALDNAKTQAEVGHLGAQTNAQNATAETTKFDLAHKKIDLAMQIVTSSRDPASAHAQFQNAVQQGLMTPQEAVQKEQEVPQDPAGFAQWRTQSMNSLMSVKDQVSAAQAAATAAETARHNKADEANTVRGQNVTAETARRGQTMENLRAGYDANGNFSGFGMPAPTSAAPAAPAATGATPPGAPIAPIAPAGGPGAPVVAAAQPAKPAGALQGLVDGIGSYSMPESVAMARVPPAMKSFIQAQVKQQYPDYDPGTYAERQASNRAFSANGKMGQAVKSFNVGLAHLDTLSDLATKLNNGQVPVLNAAGNYIAKQSGGTAQTNFEAAKNIVTDEVVKAIVGGGGGVGDREKAADTIKAAQTPQQLQQAIGTVKTLMGGQLVGLEQSYRAGTGKKDFRDRYLSPEAQKAFDALQQTGTSSSGSVPPDIAAILAKHGTK